MSNSFAIDLFCEDQGHENFLTAVLQRMRKEVGIHFKIRPRSVQGGHGKAVTEMVSYLEDVKRGQQGQPNLLVVAIAANCKGFQTASSEIMGKIMPFQSFYQSIVLACPDPHVELWYLADAEAFHQALGVVPQLPPHKCERDYYKKLLRDTIESSGEQTLLGGVEFAEEIVSEIDFYRLSKANAAFGQFYGDMKTALAHLKIL